MPGIPDFFDRLRGILDVSRDQAATELERRAYTFPLADMTGIYYEPLNGNPARCLGGAFAGPVAGQLSFVQLWNPPNSGVDCVVDGFSIFPVTSGTIHMRATTAPIGAALARTDYGRRDFRSARLPAAEIRWGTEAVQSGALRAPFFGTQFTGMELRDLDICLGPQNGLLIEHTAVNIQVSVLLHWTEYTPDRRGRG